MLTPQYTLRSRSREPDSDMEGHTRGFAGHRSQKHTCAGEQSSTRTGRGWAAMQLQRVLSQYHREMEMALSEFSSWRPGRQAFLHAHKPISGCHWWWTVTVGHSWVGLTDQSLCRSQGQLFWVLGKCVLWSWLGDLGSKTPRPLQPTPEPLRSDTFIYFHPIWNLLHRILISFSREACKRKVWGSTAVPATIAGIIPLSSSTALSQLPTPSDSITYY